MANEFDRRQKEYWDRTTNIRRHDHIVVKLFADQRVAFMRKLLDSWQPRNALDIGCGDGFGMFHMNGITDAVYGCDRSARMLHAHPGPSSRLVQCDVYSLPWKDNSFDLVYCWELLHHVADPAAVVKEMARVAAGCILVCEPNCLNPAMACFGAWTNEERGTLRFTPSYVRSLLSGEGLQRVRHNTVGYFTPNRTPAPLALLLSYLPYRVPLFGMYTVAVGFKGTGEVHRKTPPVGAVSE